VTWIEKAKGPTDPQPGNRYENGLAYDVAREVTVLFGGIDANDVALGDTWEWNGQLWKQITPSTASPSPRYGFAMAYSPVHGGVVLYGGGNGIGALGQTWRWNGVDWTLLPVGSQDPPPLFGAVMVFDSTQQKLVLYGGFNESATPDNEDVWELDVAGWKKASTLTTTPGQLSFFAMTYHAKDSVVLVHGGVVHTGFLDYTDKTWTWENQSWLQLFPVIKPPQQGYLAAAYDSKRGRTVLFGGEPIANQPNDETWEFSDGAWEQRAPIVSPKPRSAHQLAYDQKRDRVVLYGGWYGIAQPQTWEYLHYGGACTLTADCDGVSCVDGVCCSTSSCNTCQACSPVSGQCEPVVSADDADTCTGAQTCDATGACKKQNGQGCSSVTECASGFCSDGVCCDKACTASCESCGLSDSVGTCTLVTGPPAHGTCPGSGACGASCNGQNPDCAFAANGVDCGTVCEGAHITQKSCDGEGLCVTLAAEACPNHFSCTGPSACKTSCSGEADCAPGYLCAAGECIDAEQSCVDEITARDPSGNETDCTPYRCENGACGTSCTASADCAPGNLCTQKGICAPRPSSPSDEGGCGCRTSNDGGGFPLTLLGLGALLLFARRKP
jgi:MYXO-CTERM domain-containing protein